MGGVYNNVNLNLYHYAGNNPVKYTDPDGRMAFVPSIIIGVALTTGLLMLPAIIQKDFFTLIVGNHSVWGDITIFMKISHQTMFVAT